MTQIAKQFKTMDQAGRFQNRLYDKYETVQLVQFPRMSEDGTYVWRVSGKE